MVAASDHAGSFAVFFCLRSQKGRRTPFWISAGVSKQNGFSILSQGLERLFNYRK